MDVDVGPCYMAWRSCKHKVVGKDVSVGVAWLERMWMWATWHGDHANMHPVHLRTTIPQVRSLLMRF